MQEGIAGQHVAAVIVHDSEGVAIVAVEHAELTLEIGCPDIVGGSTLGERSARMRAFAFATPARCYQPVSLENRLRRADSWKRPLWLSLAKLPQQFLGAPAGATAAQLEQSSHNGLWHGVRTVAGPARPIGQAVGTFAAIALEPLVAGLAADTVAVTQLGD
jgi:hypothetical protein